MNVRELPPHEPTKLILDPTERRVASPLGVTDATQAVTRGIAEYVASLSLFAGEPPVFIKCFDEWATVDDEADYPSFAAYANDAEGTYEAASMSSQVNQHRYPNGTYETSSASLSIDVKCEIWANDPQERAALIALLEQAFSPVDWMYGFRLALPHYFNQRATFEPMKIVRLGGTQEAMQRYANARMTVRACVPVTRVLPFAQGQPKVRATVGDAPLVPPPGAVVTGR